MPTRAKRRPVHGFTLMELVVVIVLLGTVAAVVLRLQPQLFSAQAIGRDTLSGLEIQRACAERLLSVRRVQGYGAVQGSAAATPTCDGLGGVAGFAANPTVLLVDANATAVNSCSSATCTATITVSKTGSAATLPPLTLQLSQY